MVDLEFNYQLLGRMDQDCRYYLGYGNRNKRVLWSLDEESQIKLMKKLYNSFPDNKKPKWITMKDIEEYERRMITVSRR